MALVLADRVKETTTTTGTGTITLAGAATGFQSFAAVGNTNSTYYCIVGQGTSEWEVGIGTYTSSGTTLSRTTVLSSSNAGSLVSFSAGTKDVFVTYPSSRSVTLTGTETLTSKWIQPRILPSTANSAQPTLNTDNYDMMIITAQSVAITSFTTNLTGTPVNGQKLWISITGTTAIGITWGAKFESSTVTLPSTTVSTNRLDVGFVWNVATGAWRCVASA
jgi:hypothetical protein